MPEVVALFQKIAERAVAFAQMQDEFSAGIIRHREARTGKPYKLSKRQQNELDSFNEDAAKAEADMEKFISRMSDKQLLTSALSCEYMLVQLDDKMVSSYPDEDREMAQKIVDFRKETIRIIEQFIENSPFQGQVVSDRPVKK